MSNKALKPVYNIIIFLWILIYIQQIIFKVVNKYDYRDKPRLAKLDNQTISTSPKELAQIMQNISLPDSKILFYSSKAFYHRRFNFWAYPLMAMYFPDVDKSLLTDLDYLIIYEKDQKDGLKIIKY